MKINKPKFWDKQYSLVSIFLLPLTFITEILVYLRRRFIKSIKFGPHVICVGNIYIGGTGKTPLSILISKELSKKNKKVAIIRKFYKSHFDEHQLIKENFKNFFLGDNRIGSIIKAKKNGFDTVVLDDGFQDYKIHKNLSILCFNQSQLIGNGKVFPSGPLRENLEALKKTQIVIINGEASKDFEKKILEINEGIEIFYSYYEPENIEEFKNKKLLAVAGIGNPDNFFNLLIKNDLNIAKKKVFPDHYRISKKEIFSILEDAKQNNLELIMTEKDFYKIKEFAIPKVKYLKVDLIINQKEKLINKILGSYDKVY